MPGSGLVVVEAEFGLGGFEGVLNCPALPLDSDQGLDAGPDGAPSSEICLLAVRDAAPDQQPPRPDAGRAGPVFVRVEVGQFEISPLVKPWAFGALAGGQTLPGEGIEIFRDRLG